MKRAMWRYAFGATLSSLQCQDAVGRYPALQYSITPRIANGNFLLQYHYTFTQRWSEGVSSGSVVSHNTSPLLFDGFQFPVCPHMTHKFNSCTWDYRKKMTSASMTYNLKNCLKQTFPGEWSSKINQQPTFMCCGMCYTEFHVLIYKDLGHGLDPYDPKWISALRGTSIRRDEDDFGRIKNAFQVSGAILAPGSSGEQL